MPSPGTETDVVGKYVLMHNGCVYLVECFIPIIQKFKLKNFTTQYLDSDKLFGTAIGFFETRDGAFEYRSDLLEAWRAESTVVH